VSSSSAGESGDAKNTIATTTAATAAFKGAKSSRWRRFVLKPFVYVQFFFGIGLLALAFQQFRRKNTHPEQSPELIAKDWEVNILSLCYIEVVIERFFVIDKRKRRRLFHGRLIFEICFYLYSY
jgi:hypothetical protein